jgi:hypothetical protein
MAGWLPLFTPELSFPATFQGNPNVTITAISTSGGIVTSRDDDVTSAQTPYFIHVSASAITAAGTSVPYEDLEYQWDFGDPNGTETFTRPTDGATVNANSSQTGPEAAYVYRSAATYTIRLTIRGKNGGSYTTATTTKNVTVGTFTASATYYVDPGASGTGTGLSPTNAFTTISALNAVTSGPGIVTKTNLQVLFKRGTTISSSGDGVRFNVGGNTTYVGLRLDAYDSGANPIVNMTSGATSAAIVITNGGASSVTPVNDVVVSNIDWKNTSATNVACVSVAGGGNATNIMRNIYFDNCNMRMDCDTHTFGIAIVSQGSALDGHICKNWGYWKCPVTNPTTTTEVGMGILGSPQDWFFVIGGTFEGAGTSATFDHHIYPDVQTHSLYRYNSFGSSGATPTRGYCVNMNWDTDVIGTPSFADYHFVADCDMSVIANAIDAGNRTNNMNSGDGTVQFRHFVIQGNAMHELQGYSMNTLPCAKSVTFRFNRVWGATGGSSGQWFAPYAAGSGGAFPQVAPHTQLAELVARVYGNRVHTPAAIATGDAVLSFKDAGWSNNPMQITDNIFADYRAAGGGMLGYVKADQQTAGSVIDRNQFWSPNDSTSIYDGSGMVTIATHRSTFDLNGSNADPGWASTVSVWSDLD